MKSNAPLFVRFISLLDIETYNRWEKMMKLCEALLTVEEHRIAGRRGCTLDELDTYLEEVIAEV